MAGIDWTAARAHPNWKENTPDQLLAVLASMQGLGGVSWGGGSSNQYSIDPSGGLKSLGTHALSSDGLTTVQKYVTDNGTTIEVAGGGQSSFGEVPRKIYINGVEAPDAAGYMTFGENGQLSGFNGPAYGLSKAPAVPAGWRQASPGSLMGEGSIGFDDPWGAVDKGLVKFDPALGVLVADGALTEKAPSKFTSLMRGLIEGAIMSGVGAAGMNMAGLQMPTMADLGVETPWGANSRFPTDAAGNLQFDDWAGTVAGTQAAESGIGSQLGNYFKGLVSDPMKAMGAIGTVGSLASMAAGTPDNGASELRDQEQRRQAQVAGATGAVDSAFSGFNDDYYNNFTQSYLDNYLPAFNEQAKRARQKNILSSNTTSGSAFSRSAGDLESSIADTERALRESALDAANQRRQQVESTKNNLISQANAGVGIDTAAGLASSQSDILSRPPAYSPLPDLFARSATIAANENLAQSQGYQPNGYRQLLFGSSPRGAQTIVR